MTDLSKSRRAFLGSCTASALIGATGCLGVSSSERIRIGWLSPMSGRNASLGEEQRQGARLVTQQLNDNGGINGVQVESVYEDTQGNAQSGQQKAEKLVEQDNVDMVSGGFLSDVVLSIMPYMEEQNVPFLCTGAASSITREQCTRTAFNQIKRPIQLAGAMIPWATDQFGGDGWVHYADYVWGQSGRDAVEGAAADTDGASVVGTSKTSPGTTDFSTYISEMADADIDWAYIQLLGGDAVNFIQQADSYGLTDDIAVLLAGANSTKGFRQGAGDAAIGSYTTVKYAATYDTEANQAFVDAYSSEYDTPPSLLGWNMWVNGHIYDRAVTQAGTTETDPIVQTIPEIEYDTGMGTGSYRSCDHIFTLPTIIGQYSAGERYDWPGFDIVNELPAEETMLSCSETGCQLS